MKFKVGDLIKNRWSKKILDDPELGHIYPIQVIGYDLKRNVYYCTLADKKGTGTFPLNHIDMYYDLDLKKEFVRDLEEICNED